VGIAKTVRYVANGTLPNPPVTDKRVYRPATRAFGEQLFESERRVIRVRTFIVSHDGAVYTTDLGPETLDEFKRMGLQPDKSWIPVPTNKD
jgi:hypothetical protein